jgi:N-methylhydantoinase A
MSATIAIDSGGTFTDVILFDRDNGEIWSTKTPSTPADASVGFMNGVEEILGLSALARETVEQILHGTTVATNLILEDKGARTALITNAGFEHILEIGRQDIPRNANLFTWVKPTRPVPPERVFGVVGRLDVDGAELQPLDEARLTQVAEALKAQKVEAIAICFIHAYLNPVHERKAQAILSKLLPDIPISISSDVLPIFREYERTMTTMLNSYVMPRVSTYVGRLNSSLEGKGVNAPLLLMKSAGGVSRADSITREPIQTALSGPAAGVMGSLYVGDLAGFNNLITIDIGGTSADISLIKGGEPQMTHQGRIGNWPLHLPMIDIHTIGAGGGSIARLLEGGGIVVGPESAGALPGPVCYGRGGTEPTVSDANLLLGRLTPQLLDGKMGLDLDAAARAIKERIGDPLGLSPQDAALGIIHIIDNNMAGAIRVVSVERGHDPRDFTLLPFGGAGPLHGSALAKLLGMTSILVPPSPGVLSALGLLVSDLRSEFSRTCLEKPPAYNLDRIGSVFADLEKAAMDWLDSEGVAPEKRTIRWHGALRYVHQGHEIAVPWAGREVSKESVAATIEAFHAAHERLYTFSQADTPVEIVNLRVSATGLASKPVTKELAVNASLDKALAGEQRVVFDEEVATAKVYRRSELGASAKIVGPAIVRQNDSTTVIFPGQVAEVLPHGSILVRAK